MLRMGRSPKENPNDNQPQTNRQPQPYATPQTQPATPQHAQSFETHERVAATPPQPERAASHERTPSSHERAPSMPRAVTESEALARDLREGIVSGFVGSGTVVSGDAEFKGMLRIDGHFTGRVRSEKGSLIVSAGGVVDANVEVASAKINGTVNGDIVATQRIEFGRSARVRGNIQTPALIVEEGAIFEGGCRMCQLEAEPVKAAKPTETRPANGHSQTKPAAAAKPAQSPAYQVKKAVADRAVAGTSAQEPAA